MSAKTKIRKGETKKAPFSRHVEIFLEMMAAERGASANTIEAYNRDLYNFGLFMQRRREKIENADTRRINENSGLPINFNYLRNSVKAVVNAYDGTMNFYVVDENDPLILSYKDIFPNLFTRKSSMSNELLDHIRYPEDLLA